MLLEPAINHMLKKNQISLLWTEERNLMFMTGTYGELQPTHTRPTEKEIILGVINAEGLCSVLMTFSQCSE